jgi:hemerythrin-like domain-containing protein
MHLPELEADTRIREEHAELDGRCQDLCNRARAGDWADLDDVWDAFAHDLEAHFAYEEHEVFPDLARDKRGEGLVARLKAQHAMIRRRLAELGLEIQLHAVRADAIDAFVDAVRRHTELEHAEVYPRLAAN